MLVYFNVPNGVLHTDGYRIYGIQTGHDPVDLPFRKYLELRDALVDATYREGYLSKRLRKSCPPIAFSYNELKYLPEDYINKILDIFDVRYYKRWTFKRKVQYLKIMIQNVSATT